MTRYGQWAAGSLAGDAFIPLLYFGTKDAAERCVRGQSDMQVRRYRAGTWQKG